MRQNDRNTEIGSNRSLWILLKARLPDPYLFFTINLYLNMV